MSDAINDYNENSKLRSKQITKNMAKLIVLGLDIERLQNEQIPGIDDMINELLTSGYQKADKIIYELRIASFFLEQGQTIEFLKESPSSRTPDLLINNEIQLDCKKKNLTTKRDNLNYEYFQKIWHDVVVKLTSEKNTILPLHILLKQMILKIL